MQNLKGNFRILKYSAVFVGTGQHDDISKLYCINTHISLLQVNGRIDSYKRFKAMLLVELSHVFPNEMTRYRAVREELS